MEKEMMKEVTFNEFEPTSYEQWKDEAIATLKGAPFEKKLFTKTYEGITLQPIYTKEDTEDLSFVKTYPGVKDFVRGTDPAGYLAEPWKINQAVEALLPADANAIIKAQLSRGVNSINIKLNDSAKNYKHYNKETKGVCLVTLRDAHDLFDGIDLTKLPLHIEGGASVLPLIPILTAYMADEKPLLTGCVGADPVASVLRAGNSQTSMKSLYDEMAIVAKYAAERLPNLKTIMIDGSVYNDGGASSVQELAYTLATAIAYIDELMARGLTIDEAAAQIRFSITVSANFFMEIAKLRAIKMLWAQIIIAFGGSEEAKKIDLFVKTSKFNKTYYDPYVNILRTTTEAFSGVVGGINGMEVAPFDAVVGESDELSRRIAGNIQVMLQSEFDLLQPVDPAGGSWYVESLTNEIAEAAWAELQKVEEMGGICTAAVAGYMQAEIAKVLTARKAKLATRGDKVVGSNMYANTTEAPLVKDVDLVAKRVALREEQIKELKAKQNNNVTKGICEDDRVVVNIKYAYLANACSIGIRETLDDGEGFEITAIEVARLTEDFEALRKRTEDFRTATGENVKVFLANYGAIPNHKPRADFSTGFMEVANFEIIKNDGYKTAEEVGKAAVASGADVVIICGKDADYSEIVPVIAADVKAGLPKACLILAGAPNADLKPICDAAGVDEYIHVKANCLDILTKIQIARGIC